MTKMQRVGFWRLEVTLWCTCSRHRDLEYIAFVQRRHDQREEFILAQQGIFVRDLYHT